MMDWHLVLSSSAFAISVASLLMSRHAWTIAEEAKGKARHSLRVSVYSVEVNRKRLGIPYDHDVVEQYEANEGIFASMGVGSYKGRRCKERQHGDNHARHWRVGFQRVDGVPQ